MKGDRCNINYSCVGVMIILIIYLQVYIYFVCACLYACMSVCVFSFYHDTFPSLLRSVSFHSASICVFDSINSSEVDKNFCIPSSNSCLLRNLSVSKSSALNAFFPRVEPRKTIGRPSDERTKGRPSAPSWTTGSSTVVELGDSN